MPFLVAEGIVHANINYGRTFPTADNRNDRNALPFYPTIDRDTKNINSKSNTHLKQNQNAVVEFGKSSNF